MTQIKLPKKDRVAQLLAAALDLAVKVGYNNVTREAIAQRAGVADRLVSYHMGTMPTLRRDIVRQAVHTECLPVIAQAAVAKDKHLKKCPPALIQKALQAVQS